MNNDELMHVGRSIDDYPKPPGRGSGRWPKGWGKNPYQHLDDGRLRTRVKYLKEHGFTEKEIANNMGVSTGKLRALQTIERDREINAQYTYVYNRIEQGETNQSKIARELGVSEGKVRNILADVEKAATKDLTNVCDNLKSEVSKKKMLDVGEGTERILGIKDTKLQAALTKLELEDDYHVVNIYPNQLGSKKGNKTTQSILCKKDIDNKYIYDHLLEVRQIDESKRIDINGDVKVGSVNPKSVDRSRIKVMYDEDGGSNKDGVIELRRGVDDISLGRANYAQVRIAVDDKMYMKGMAYYNDETFKNMPKGIDMVYYSNKKKGSPDLGEGGVFKALKSDPDNPFGATIKGLYDEDRKPEDKELKLTQRYYVDENGKKQQSCINVISEEGTWSGWSKSLSSQFLAKQTIPLARRQLDLAYKRSLSDFEDIMKITEPAVKEKMLLDFAESCDSSAVDLKAAALPRQSTSVLLPVVSLKDNEVYAPNYNNGDRLCLVRHPHEGIYQIPYLTVNNNNKEGKSVVGNSPDAIGINPKVASQLSGADFDGDSVLCLRVGDKNGDFIHIKHKDPIPELVDFNTKIYKLPKVIDPKTGEEKYKYPPVENQQKQQLMGIASNLITDMTQFKEGVVDDELVRATKYSMVVIDSEKHKLDWKQAYEDFGIAELNKKYRGRSNAGASTIMSRAKSPIKDIPERKRFPKIDPETGENVWEETGKTRPDWKVVKEIDPITGKKVDKIDPETGNKVWEYRGEKPVYQSSTKMAETKDAYSLTSDKKGERYPMEGVYAKYANEMKALANRARKESLGVVYRPYEPSAAETYKDQVKSLETKYLEVTANQPRERMATTYSNGLLNVKMAEDPTIKDDKDKYKKAKTQCLAAARAAMGAHSEKIILTDKEWDAIQSGAIRKTQLKKILNKVDSEELKRRAMPKANQNTLSKAKKDYILSLYSSSGNGKGMTIAEIAEQIGVSPSTVSKVIATR